VCLYVDFVEFNLTPYRFPCGFQEFVVLHPRHVLGPYIGGDFEVSVFSRLDGYGNQYGDEQKDTFKIVS
jgi:hypothetical protein